MSIGSEIGYRLVKMPIQYHERGFNAEENTVLCKHKANEIKPQCIVEYQRLTRFQISCANANELNDEPLLQNYQPDQSENGRT